MMKTSLINYFDETGALSEDRIAVCDAARNYSFMGMLTQKVLVEIHSQGASVLRSIAVYLSKCAGMMIADFDILIMGNGFMNLDVKTPGERIVEILKTIDPLTVITNEPNRRNIAQAVRLSARNELSF